jgi:hypothetical protein
MPTKYIQTTQTPIMESKKKMEGTNITAHTHHRKKNM